jgi:hypothetical protein
MRKLGFTKLPLGSKLAIIVMVVGITLSLLGRLPFSASTSGYAQGFDEIGMATMVNGAGHIYLLGIDISTSTEMVDVFTSVMSLLSALGISLFLIGMAYALRSAEDTRANKGSLKYYLIAGGAAVVALSSALLLLYHRALLPAEAEVASYYLLYLGLLICLVGSLFAFRAASLGRARAGASLVIVISICSIASFLVLGFTQQNATFGGDANSLLFVVYFVGHVFFFVGLMSGWRAVRSGTYDEQRSMHIIFVATSLVLIVWAVLAYANFGNLYGSLPIRNEDFPALANATIGAEIIGITAALSFCAYLGIRSLSSRVVAPGREHER